MGPEVLTRTEAMPAVGWGQIRQCPEPVLLGTGPSRPWAGQQGCGYRPVLGGTISTPRRSGRSGAAAVPAPGARCHPPLCAGGSGQPRCRWRPRAAAEGRHPRRPAPAAPSSCPGAAMWGSPAGGCLDCWARGKSHSLQADSGRSCPATTPGDGAGASLQDGGGGEERSNGVDGVVRVSLALVPTSLISTGPAPFPLAVCTSLLSGSPFTRQPKGSC